MKYFSIEIIKTQIFTKLSLSRVPVLIKEVLIKKSTQYSNASDKEKSVSLTLKTLHL